MADVRTPPSDPTEPLEAERSLSELVGELTNDVSELVTTHIELAKVEIKEEVAKAGKGAGMLGAGAGAGLLAVLLLSFAAAWGLAELMAPGLAFLIVGLVWAAVAAFLALTGRRRLADARMPEQTVDEVKEDARWVRQQRAS